MTPVRYLRATAVVAAVMAALFAIDRALARLEVSEIQREANEKYRSGMRLLKAGDPKQALVNLRRAHSLARDNGDYTLGLSEALIANGLRAEAEARLGAVLVEDSNDGRANLLLARLLAAETQQDRAIAFYHRAIYGTWPRGSDSELLKARLELAEYLAKTNRPRELLSELLLLQDSANNNVELSREIASLFLAAGSGPRAAQMYRGILEVTPGDWRAYQGIGEADLLAGDYRAAQTMFLAALRNHPSDEGLAHKLRFANTLAKLDPTPRGLSSAEKYNRSRNILEAVVAEVEQCAAASTLLPAARDTLAAKRSGPVTNEFAEAPLAIAEHLWDLCPGSRRGDDPSAAIMEKLKQTR